MPERGNTNVPLIPSDLGFHALVFDHHDVVRLLSTAVGHEGGQTAFAERHDVTRTYVNMILHGKRGVSDSIAKALGLRKAYVTDSARSAASGARITRPDLIARNLGFHALVFDMDDVVRLLKAAVEREGGQTAFAERHGVDRVCLNRILTGKRGVIDSIAKTLGLGKVYVAE